MRLMNNHADSCMWCAHSECEPNKQPCKICARNGYNSTDLKLNYFELPDGINHVELTDDELLKVKNLLT